MKMVALLLCSGMTMLAQATDGMSSDEINSMVIAVNEAQNKAMMHTASMADVESLFSLYTDDFAYIHEVYGGAYTREHLYRNTAKNVKTGHYKLTVGRYKILRVIAGLNAAAVERLEVASGKVHLSVFEFKGRRVARIVEYWK